MTSLRFAAGGALATSLAALAALLAGGFADFAAAATYNPGHLTSEQLAQVEQLCETNLHLRPGESHFEGCVAGLSDSLTSVSRADAVLGARQACFDKRQIAGSPDLAECLLDASEGRTAADASVSSNSYFRASSKDIRRGERLSCARLGLDPISGAFEDCVANLAGALDAVDRPTN